jgi:hypothetical protein
VYCAEVLALISGYSAAAKVLNGPVETVYLSW